MTATTNGTTELTPAELMEYTVRQDWQIELLQERLAELELSLEDVGWRRLMAGFDGEFSRSALGEIVRRSRYAYLANPLVNHALEVQAHYVFGQGVQVAARHPAINDVIRAVWEDPGNRAELTSAAAQLLAEIELASTGNLFLVLFTDARTGHLRIRSIPIEDVQDIVTDPQDRRTPWFYRRVWTERQINNGRETDVRRVALYPDWRYQPRRNQRPASIGGVPVHWTAPVMHRAVGGTALMRFGVPETYSALDWVVAVREDLERFATIRRAQAMFATRITTAGGRKGVAAAKARLATTVGTSSAETNPPPIAGSTFVGAAGAAEYDVVRLGGAAPHPEDARRLGLMAAAGLGIPETILFGNADVGNLATSKTLDRPTELKMRARQELWNETIRDLLDYAIDQAILAPAGPLRTLATVTRDAQTGAVVITMRPDPSAQATGPDAEPIDRTPLITFPEILERDTKARVDAIVAGAGRLPESAERTIARLILAALDVDDIDAVMDELYPPEDDGAEADAPAAPVPDMDAMFIASLRDLRDVLESIRRGA